MHSVLEPEDLRLKRQSKLNAECASFTGAIQYMAHKVFIKSAEERAVLKEAKAVHKQHLKAKHGAEYNKRKIN